VSCNYHRVLKYILTFVVQVTVNRLVSPCFLTARYEIVRLYKGGFDDDDDREEQEDDDIKKTERWLWETCVKTVMYIHSELWPFL
jgi:hypothetical protein